MVSFISIRELSSQPDMVLTKVSEEDPQIITQNGVPAAYLIPQPVLQGIAADLDVLHRLLLDRALDTAQAEAARSGASELSGFNSRRSSSTSGKTQRLSFCRPQIASFEISLFSDT